MKALLVSTLILFLSCSSKQAESTTSVSATTQDSSLVSSDSAKEITTNIKSVLPYANDPINEKGLLKEVEDAGYPIAVLRIEFPERGFEEYFTVNFEETKSTNINKLRSWVGKYVSFDYESDLENALIDIQVKGKSILGEYAPELTPEMMKITGVLKGADEETPGDLPGRVSITTKEKEVYEFDYFVTPEMVALNGKTVTAYYEERTANTIKSIKLMK